MRNHGTDFYDNDANFEKYMQRRQWQENANDTLEKPVIMELLGDISDRHILDLGCGDAGFGVELLKKGCAAYVGIEGSRKMAEASESNLTGFNNGTVQHMRMEDYAYPRDTYDVVISRLAIHYLQDIESVFRGIHQTLKPCGKFIFSIEHPVITSTLQPSGIRTNWVVDNYFIEGYREQQWLGGTVHKYHRTVEDYFMALTEAGFRVASLRESKPVREHFLTEETYERRRRIPLFLFLEGVKNG
ncbi:methyltransferase domain-containing protein [Paenibacillus lactis]|uniref:class I SAM-dependent DNA methyltransferase n=1 Tax=Paenibacillus lactis TaxID=228574 RepID=UPI00203BF755|nr:class I SAM-dependent methyltransferase [Paenibacillus lactis]MCM3494811.1 methyltransferase domain-containing protein [Paenibacillus lactis]